MRRFTWFNATSLTLGFAFLYLPMVILVIYSFTARGSSPHGVPATHTQGFARFLHVIAQHDWEGAPLIVDLDDGGTRPALNTQAVACIWMTWCPRR